MRLLGRAPNDGGFAGLRGIAQRVPRSWENMQESYNTEYRRKYKVPEWEGSIESELAALLDPGECSYILGRKNRATQLLELQSEDLRRSAEASLPGEMKHLELERLLAAFADTQGRCERIKNYPYPRLRSRSASTCSQKGGYVLCPICLLARSHSCSPT